MDRRRFLASIPPVACLAGCAQEPQPGVSKEQPTQNQSRTITRTRTPTVSEPSSISIQFRSSYRYIDGLDSIGVKSPESDQFAFVTPPVSEGSPAPSAFHLRLGDEQFTPASSVPGIEAKTPGVEGIYTTDDRRGSLVFDIPTVETENAALLFDGTRYPLTEVARGRLATAPEFSLESVSVPDSVAPDENVELSITVTNAGDAAGTYLAGFRTSGLPKAIDVPLEPGETETGSVTYDADADHEAMQFFFASPGGRRDYEVVVRSAATTD